MKSSVAIAQQHADIARVANLSGALMSNHYVRLAVSVHVADNHRKDNQPTRDERHFWLESSVAVTQQYAAAATDPAEWDAFASRYVFVGDDEYKAHVAERQP